MHKHTLLTLFCSFFKIGAFTFGGGYAMIPIIHKEAIETHGWIDDAEMLDIIAIAESTPGVLAVNTATFVGYKVGGFWGSALATIGVVLPSFFIISILSYFIAQVRDNFWVSAAFEGIRAGVIVLLINAVVKLSSKTPKSVVNYVLMAIAFVLVAFFNVKVIPILVGVALFGILYSLWILPKLQKRKEAK